MSAYIHHIATQPGPYKYEQSFIRDRMKSWATSEKSRRMLHALYQRSGIQSRYSVLDDFNHDEGGALFQITDKGVPTNPGTAERNQIYASAARDMAVKVSTKALKGSGFAADEITHVIYASCTGFVNPGPDLHLIYQLGLNHQVERYTLGFMGCYAAFPALRMAAQFCEANADAVVLVVCLELCTLHMQLEDGSDNMLANSLFADGAAAAVVSAKLPQSDKNTYRLDGFVSSLVRHGEEHMAWDVGNHGFNIVLSSYVPDIIGAELRPMLEPLLNAQGLSVSSVDEWAVHPGGRAILDKVQQSLGLDTNALDVSRHILADYGNMSSATVLFVLEEMLRNTSTSDASVCALAFGPGLTVETAFLHRINAKTSGEFVIDAVIPTVLTSTMTKSN